MAGSGAHGVTRPTTLVKAARARWTKAFVQKFGNPLSSRIHNRANMSEAMEVADRPKMTAKQLWICAAWLGGGMVLGHVTDNVLFPLWSKLEPLEPIPGWLDWLVTSTSDVVLWIWFVLWSNAPRWCAVAIIGILRGRFTQADLVVHLLLFGLGFALLPLAFYIYSHSALPSFNIIAQHVISIGLIIVFGLVSHRFEHRKMNESRKVDALE